MDVDLNHLAVVVRVFEPVAARQFLCRLVDLVVLVGLFGYKRLVLAALREDSERPPGARIASATESSRRKR